MNKLVFEIGTEELPANSIISVLNEIAELAQKLFFQKRIRYGSLKTYATPRRLVMIMDNLASTQSPTKQVLRGPKLSIAYDENGAPTKAAIGFAKKMGVLVDQLQRDKESVFVTNTGTANRTVDELPAILEAIVSELHFPRAMKWGNSEFQFLRPIRWIVALLDDVTIPIKIANVTADQYSRGHRVLGSQHLFIPNADKYIDTLASSYVLVDPKERESIIRKQMYDIESQLNVRIEIDQELLNEVVFLIEYPTVLVGKFDEHYLSLPDPLIKTPMKEHQRYFPVYSGDTLTSMFVTVRNGNKDYLETVQQGNEKVLEARLADAWFFYNEDLKNDFESNIEKLKLVVYQDKIGTVYDKTLSLVKITDNICDLLGVSQEIRKSALRASYLSKADLSSNVVYEFPELQGVMGNIYSLHNGEARAVATAIEEQYMPVNAFGILPRTIIGRICSISEKIYNIVANFAAGLIPNGSKDPYALRRQAIGLCRIIIEAEFSLSLTSLVSAAIRSITLDNNYNSDKLFSNVYLFLGQRLRGVFKNSGYNDKIIEAVVSVGYDEPTIVAKKIDALSSLVENTVWTEQVSNMFNRVSNLISGKPEKPIDPDLFSQKEEIALWILLNEIETEVDAYIRNGDYKTAGYCFIRFSNCINEFFNNVKVVVADKTLMLNRIALLRRVCAVGLCIANYSILR